jgi:hypothetical protein
VVPTLAFETAIVPNRGLDWSFQTDTPSGDQNDVDVPSVLICVQFMYPFADAATFARYVFPAW